MYHDEFAKRPANRNPKWDDFVPDLAMQVGGGLSLALAVSLNRPASMVLFTIGGRLPIVAWCMTKTVAQTIASFTGLAPKVGSKQPSALPTPHILARLQPRAAAHPRRRQVGSTR